MYKFFVVWKQKSQASDGAGYHISFLMELQTYSYTVCRVSMKERDLSVAGGLRGYIEYQPVWKVVDGKGGRNC
jgi:hypothetical protein